MDLIITSHAVERLIKRGKCSNFSELLCDSNFIPNLESELLNGAWYKDEKGYACVVNNLWVYCGVLKERHGRKRLVLTTSYPYEKEKR